jgi:iron transport multicopper oxidase
MIEAPLELQNSLHVPDDHYAACRAAGMPTTGNAAGNSADPLDLAGANVSPPRMPDGFEARGIVALVFSVVVALVGCVVIGWYGMMPLKG